MTPERRATIEAMSIRLHGYSTGDSMIADVIDELLTEIDRRTSDEIVVHISPNGITIDGLPDCTVRVEQDA